MGSCCGGNVAEDNAGESQTSLNGGNKNSKGDAKHKRRHTSNKGITRLTMKFPHVRYSFKACQKTFEAACSGDKESITKGEVKPLLITLGADESTLSDEEIQRIIKTANLDGDNDIDFKEFLIAAAVGCFLHEPTDIEQQSDEFKKIRKGFLVAKEAFEFIDADGSGEIDFEELCTAFSAMKQDDLITERLKELDFNGDKSVELPEFIYGLTAWVGMDPDADDGISAEDFDDGNTKVNQGDVLSPKHRLSVDDGTNPNFAGDPNET